MAEFYEIVHYLKINRPCCSTRFACVYYTMVLETGVECPDTAAANTFLKNLGIQLQRDPDTGKVTSMTSPYWDTTVPVDARFYQ